MSAERPKNNVARAVDMLRELIFSGTLAPGSDHLETELALRLGMSRTPVREATLTLEAQGLLQVRARRGVRILPISIKDMEEIYDVLTALESTAAADAAAANHADTGLDALAATISAMEDALAVQNREAWADADDQFHAELVRLGGNQRIVSITQMMADQVRRARAVTLYMRPLPVKSNADHRAVLDAIRRGDATLARKIHARHRAAAKATLVGLLKQHHLTQL
ncbi:MAG: GntR family transcriptional regulator [Pseudomonadota bacterium]